MQTLRQDLRQRLEQTIQPLQILRSELIQLPLLELELRVNSELEENPFLEEADTDEAETSKETEELPVPKTAEELDEAANEDTSSQTEAKEIDWEEILNDEDYYEYRPRTLPAKVEIQEIPRAARETMIEQVRSQLGTDRLIGDKIKIGEYILGSLRPDGYLDVSVEEIAQDLNVSATDVERVLKRIQSYDPPGIAARNLQECLLIQLRRQKDPHPLAVRMVTECFDEFINKKYEVIAKKLDISLEEVKEAFQIVTKLNPKPGEGTADEKQNYIIPDLVVTQAGNDFEIYLNDGTIPNFRVNAEYRDLVLSKKKVDKKTREFVHKKLESARWFINAIHQRRNTMLRTMRAIVKRQEDFSVSVRNT